MHSVAFPMELVPNVRDTQCYTGVTVLILGRAIVKKKEKNN